MRFFSLISFGRALKAHAAPLVCFTLAESERFMPARWHTGPGSGYRRHSERLPSVRAVRRTEEDRASCTRCVNIPSLLFGLTSPVPSVGHNRGKHLNIHSIHILIDCVFSAQINCILS